MMKVILSITNLRLIVSNTQLSYKDAGVDIHAGNELVERIKADVKRTRRPEVMGGLKSQFWCLAQMAWVPNYA